MRLRRTLFAVLLVVMMAAMVLPASAEETQTYTGTFSSIPFDFGTEWIPQFNPLHGPCTKVDVILDPSITALLTVKYNGVQPVAVDVFTSAWTTINDPIATSNQAFVSQSFPGENFVSGQTKVFGPVSN